MKPDRKVSFAGMALGRERTLPSPRKQVHWDVVTGWSTFGSMVISLGSAVISLVILYVAIRALRDTGNQIEDFRRESQTQHFVEKAQEFNIAEFRNIRRALAPQRLNGSQDHLRAFGCERDQARPQ